MAVKAHLILLLRILFLATTLSSSSPTTEAKTIRVSLVPETQVVDPTHFSRQSKEEIEVVVVQAARGTGLLTFYLNGRPIAKIAPGEAILLYLAPRRYRFGLMPSNHFGGAIWWETNAEVSRDISQVYRIFQSAGFTSSGGNAVYEIAQVGGSVLDTRAYKPRSRGTNAASHSN